MLTLDKTKQINYVLVSTIFKGCFVFLLLTFAFSLFISSAYAATFTVNSTTDAVDASPGNGTCATAGSVCTVRAAIQEANALAGTDTIILPAGTYTLSIAGTEEDAAATGDLDITSDMTIDGANESTTIIDATTIDRAIDIPSTAIVTIQNLTVKNGDVEGKGGGINNSQTGSTLTLNHVTVSDNTANNSGGGIQNDGTANLTNVTIKSNSANAGGGMISDGTLTITASTFDGNNAPSTGAGLYNDFSGTSTLTHLTNVTFSNNTAVNSGGGLRNDDSISMYNVIFTGNDGGNYGGGVYNDFGTVTGTNITFNNNQAHIGGGIENVWILNLTNATINGNTATEQGGGIDVSFANSTVLTNVTIANNTAPTSKGAGIYLWDSADTATLKNTILATNATENCAGTGTFTSSGYNLSSDSSCASSFNQTGDLNSTNPLLSALADNGGSVQTMALQSGSPAIDAGTNTGCTSTDARGTSRPQDGDNNGTSTCDIGAYEYVYVAPTLSSSSSSSSSSSNSSAPSCNDSAPSSSPNLFEIDTSFNSATLYISPVSGANKYAVIYGHSPTDERYGAEVSVSDVSGVIPIVINDLAPNTSYYFKVRAGNGCMPGPWGNQMKATTTNKGSTQIHQFFKGFLFRFTSFISKKTKPVNLSANNLFNLPSNCQYTIIGGDSLWSIASSTLGGGAKYPTIIELNKATYPTLSPTSLLHIGWKLKVC